MEIGKSYKLHRHILCVGGGKIIPPGKIVLIVGLNSENSNCVQVLTEDGLIEVQFHDLKRSAVLL